MKINCQSCEAKYTIADDKVRGKTVKIRCKKCGAAIVVKGTDLPPDQGNEEEEDDATRVYPHAGAQASAVTSAMDWTLNMPDGEQRAVSVEEIAQLFASGAINAETYAWRDGMADWLPLNQIVELAPALAGQAAPAPRPSGAPSADPRLAGIGGDAGGQARVAARRQERARDQDLFGGARQAGSDEDVAARAAAAPAAAAAPKHTFTAERGENSILFSVDAIRATAKPASTSKAPSAGGDKIDFTALASNIPPPMDAPVAGFDQVPESPPSFPNFGGPMLAAPMLPTSIEPEPPPPEPSVVGAAESGMPAKSNKGLVIGLAAAVVLLAAVALAFGGYVLFSHNKPAEEAAAAPSASAAVTAEPAASAPAAATTETAAAASASAAPEEAKTGEAAVESAAKAGETAKSGSAKEAKADTAKEAKADTAKKDEPKKEEAKKDEPAAADTAAAAPAAAAPFSRGAAVSALNAAAGAASGCKKADGPTGRGRVSVTFAPSGKVSSAVVNGPPFAGTSVGGCVAAAFRRASVPPFSGSPVTVHKSFSIE